MGWKLTNKPKTVKVSRALAKEFAEMEPAPQDRPLSERRLEVYGKMLANGEFRPVTWAKAYCKEVKGEYRVNGKHTSTLLFGMDRIPEFYVTVEEYECDVLEDVARLYATFDSRMQTRTAHDINFSFAGTDPKLASLPHRTINLAVSGMAYVFDPHSRETPPEKAERLLEYPEFVVWMDDILAGDRTDPKRQNSKHLARQAVIAAMFSTYQRSPEDATVFWNAVRDETGESPQCPDRKLARFLMTTGVNMGGGVNRVKKVGTREMYAKSIHGWNAWRKDEPTSLRYYEDAELPKAM